MPRNWNWTRIRAPKKSHFKEDHPEIVELRAAIDKGHAMRAEKVDPAVLVSQTERNIVNKEKVIADTLSKFTVGKKQNGEFDPWPPCDATS